jgi:hypothetical protein
VGDALGGVAVRRIDGFNARVAVDEAQDAALRVGDDDGRAAARFFERA